VIAAPVLALSTLNCTLATATLSLAVAIKLTVPESVPLAAGNVIETIGAVVSAAVVNVRSLLTAAVLAASVECTRQWYKVAGFKLPSVS
jgi:N-methylhydantoinase B/oxoprolinase/acetone carboxylase alpha subunit